MRNENIHEHANYVGYFLNYVTFDTVQVFDLQYSHKYTCIYCRLYSQSSGGFLTLSLSEYSLEGFCLCYYLNTLLIVY